MQCKGRQGLMELSLQSPFAPPGLVPLAVVCSHPRFVLCLSAKRPTPRLSARQGRAARRGSSPGPPMGRAHRDFLAEGTLLQCSCLSRRRARATLNPPLCDLKRSEDPPSPQTIFPHTSSSCASVLPTLQGSCCQKAETSRLATVVVLLVPSCCDWCC